MTLASDVANMLIEKGYKNIKPWTSSKTFGHERIYYKKGYVELSGKYGFRTVDLDIESKFTKDCESCLYKWMEKRKKYLDEMRTENLEVPF